MRIAITGTDKWALQGVALALQRAGGAQWDLRVLRPDEALATQMQSTLDVLVAVQPDRELGARLATGVAPGVPILWLSDAAAPAGAPRPTGQLRADADDVRLLAAIQALAAGLHVADDGHRLAAAPASDNVLSEPLTPRELEVLELMAKGLGNRDIAQALGISSHTAKFHVAQILEKAGAATRTEAVRQALRLGLIGL